MPAGDKEYNEPWTNEDGYIILTLNGPGRVSAGPLSKKIAGGSMDRNEQLFTFIEESPTPYHVVRTISRTLLEEGFQELKEQESWQLWFVCGLVFF